MTTLAYLALHYTGEDTVRTTAFSIHVRRSHFPVGGALLVKKVNIKVNLSVQGHTN